MRIIIYHHMKKLFKRVGENRFILNEGEHDHYYFVQQNNEYINKSRRVMRFYNEYLEKVLESPYASQEDKEFATKSIKYFESMDKALARGYLDSGYKYDDDDPRNKLDQMDDSWFERERAREGSDEEEMLESQIRQQIVVAKIKQKTEELKSYFTLKKANEIFGSIQLPSEEPFNPLYFNDPWHSYSEKDPKNTAPKRPNKKEFGKGGEYSREFHEKWKQYEIDWANYLKSDEFKTLSDLNAEYNRLKELKKMEGYSIGEWVSECIYASMEGADDER